jgi:hypothetical protein
MWYNLYTNSGEKIRINLYSRRDGYFRGVDVNGNDLLVNEEDVQKVELAEGNNDYYGYSTTFGGIEGLGYG